jgi:hypothetical protein
MANMKYFSDYNGETIELVKVRCILNEEFASKFPLVNGVKVDRNEKFVGFKLDDYCAFLPVTRVIEYKSHPSKHVCNARCTGATGRVMKCECSCGGKNHGRG